MASEHGRLRFAPGSREVDAAAYLSLLEERFGMDPGYFIENYHFFLGGRKYLYCLTRGHLLPPGPEIVFSGIKFMRIAMEVPKLTTAATVAFGNLAHRNLVDLTPESARAYLRREERALSPEEVRRCDSPGYVIARHHGIPLGTGYLRLEGDGKLPSAARLQSWFPKHMSRGIEL